MPDDGTTADPVAAQRNVLTIRGKPHEYCAACPVQRGECPLCGTFWVPASEPRYTGPYGIVRVDWPDGHVDGPTNGYGVLDQLPNVLADRPWRPTPFPNVLDQPSRWLPARGGQHHA